MSNRETRQSLLEQGHSTHTSTFTHRKQTQTHTHAHKGRNQRVFLVRLLLQPTVSLFLFEFFFFLTAHADMGRRQRQGSVMDGMRMIPKCLVMSMILVRGKRRGCSGLDRPGNPRSGSYRSPSWRRSRCHGLQKESSFQATQFGGCRNSVISPG